MGDQNNVTAQVGNDGTLTYKESVPKPDGGWITVEVVVPFNTPMDIVVANLVEFASLREVVQPMLLKALDHAKETPIIPSVVEAGDPVTMVVNFGKHKGKTVVEIGNIDLPYLEWLAREARDPLVRATAEKELANLNKLMDNNYPMESVFPYPDAPPHTDNDIPF